METRVTSTEIKDPVAFLEADPGILSRITPGDELIVCGSDIEFMLRGLTQEPRDLGTIVHSVSPFLGPLYTRTESRGIRLNHRTFAFDLISFPSAARTNGLMENMGLELGKNAIRHTANPDLQVEATLASGQYALSTRPGWFIGSRSTSAIGRILLPPRIGWAVMTTARVAETRSQTDSRSRSQNIVGIFEHMTSCIGQVTTAMTEDGKPFIFSQPRNLEMIDALIIATDAREYLADIWGMADRKRNLRAVKNHIEKKIAERIEELDPVVEKLKTELKTATASP